MNILDTSDLEFWPREVAIAYSRHLPDVSPAILSSNDRMEFQTFTNAQRKIEFLTGRYLFQRLLPRFNLQPEHVQMYKEEKGKPYALAGDTLVNLSFSHSQDIVACAVSLKYRIGLDVESFKRQINNGVLARILDEQEWDVIGRDEPLRLWTIKEAVLKCSGHGLQTVMRNLAIRKYSSNHYLLRFNDENRYEICSFNALNHQIALAYQSTDYKPEN